MPKANKITKVDNRVVRIKVPTKLRIGTRKSGISALSMTLAKLKETLDDISKKKWHNNARKAISLKS